MTVLPTARLRRLRMPSGTSGAALRASITPKAARRTTAAARAAMTGVDPHPLLVAWETAKTRELTPAVTVSAPGRSRRAQSRPGGDGTRLAAAAMSSTTPMGTLMNST